MPRFFSSVAALAILAALLVGCGSGGDDTNAQSATDAAKVFTHLNVSLDRDGKGGKPAERARIDCGPNIDPPSAACPFVDKLPADAGAPAPPDQPCTELYGGTDVVKLSGTLHGAKLDATLTRVNGCEISRFEVFTPILKKLFPGYRPGSSIRQDVNGGAPLGA